MLRCRYVYVIITPQQQTIQLLVFNNYYFIFRQAKNVYTASKIINLENIFYFSLSKVKLNINLPKIFTGSAMYDPKIKWKKHIYKESNPPTLSSNQLNIKRQIPFVNFICVFKLIIKNINFRIVLTLNDAIFFKFSIATSILVLYVGFRDSISFRNQVICLMESFGQFLWKLCSCLSYWGSDIKFILRWLLASLHSFRLLSMA